MKYVLSIFYGLFLCALFPEAIAWSPPNTGRNSLRNHHVMEMSASPIRFWRNNNNRNAAAAAAAVVRKEIRVRPRPTVMYNPTTGTITTESSQSNKSTGWRSLKSRVYKTVDAVKGLTTRRSKSKISLPKESYHEVIERPILIETSSTTTTPGQRLMQEYKQRGPTLQVIQPKPSTFDSLKESVYSAADTVFGQKEVQVMVPPPVSFKASIQPTIASSPQVRDALPQLQSQNPITRFIAEQKIREWESQQQRREAALQREEQIRALKETIYSFVDTVQVGAELIWSTPGKIIDTVTAFLEWAQTVPSAIQSTAETIGAIPGQVTKTVTEVRDTVDTSIKTTQKFVDDVAAIPKKVQQTVEDTQKSIENTVKSVDEAATTVKVWTGLEKPKPKPPKTPPKVVTPKPLSELPMEIAGTVAENVVKGGAHVAWWVAKGAVQLTWKGTKAAFMAVTSSSTIKQQKQQKRQQQQQQQQQQGGKTKTVRDKIPTPPQSSPPPLTLMDVTSQEFDVEVTEALQLAQAALEMAQELDNEKMDKTKSYSDTVGSDKLKEAVQRAKAAAIAATQDAVDIERSIQKKRLRESKED